MKKLFLIATLIFSSLVSNATIHTIDVWDGYYQFVPNTLTISLGDTIQWLPLGGGAPTMVHSITSTNIPGSAATFDYIWQAPADTFFQYIPTVAGVYDYECTPHAAAPLNMVGQFTVTSGTSVKEQVTKKKSFWFYPNPAKDKLNIDQEYLGKIFKVFSLQGKEKYHGVVTQPLDISNWAEGTYFLMLVGDKPKVHKIVKLP